MLEISQQNASAFLPIENLFINLKTAKKFFSAKSQIFESTEMKDLFALFKKKNIKETQLNQLDKMEKMTVASSVNNSNVSDVVSLKFRLTTELESNRQLIETQIKKILANNQHKSELRSLVARNVQLIEAKKQLAEAFSEKIIDEEEAQRFKSLINAEFGIFYSESVRELYQCDLKAILQVGISESVLSYLKDLSQLDEVIRPIIEKEIDNYQNEQANNWIESAERRIAEQVQENSQRIDLFTSSARDHFLSHEAGFNEDKPMSPLYTADSADAIYELLLNGADPIKESNGLEIAPLTQHFVSRYITEQELSRVEHISMSSVQIQLNSKFAKPILFQQYSEDKKELKTELNNQIETLRAKAEWHPELKMDLGNQIKELNKKAKQRKINLKNDLEDQIKELKKKTKALTPELKIELNNQFERLKTEADGLKLELKNNTTLIDAHIKAIVLRDGYAQVSDYPDIAVKERFQQTWNNCKQEIKALQQTQLTENCTTYNFLTQDLAQLPIIEAKTLKSAIKHFPEYKPLLQMQSDLLNNYQLVQGPQQVAPATELRRVVDTSNHSVKAPDFFETNTSEKQGTPSDVKISTENNLLIQPFGRTRLNNSAFFSASFQSKSSVPEKFKNVTSRLNGSLFFAIAKTPSDFSLVKERSVAREVCYTK